ncbi:MAG: peptidoglycan DD-metalloendopeptidase family protein [Bacteroidota bacterium]
MHSKQLGLLSFLLLFLIACKNDRNTLDPEPAEELTVVVEEEKFEFGFKLNDYVVKRDTIRKGDTFGIILERNRIGYPKIFQIAEKAKDTFNITKLQVGKPYTVLCSKDSLETAQSFIYQPNKEEYVVINFKDSIHAYNSRKPIKYVERFASGIINSSISETLESQSLSPKLAYIMADDIYAWTIDFRRLQKGDRFKAIYVDKYIDDTIYVGVHKIKAAYFEHKNEPIYAFEFVTDEEKGIVDYFTDEAKNLRRAFLKSPVKFGRVSSRYNLNRRIAYYGYKRIPHKGTDFAAPIGTPIMATANGTVTESTRRGGNGKYVKIRHNATYSTQYLHMSRQAVKKGDFVKQGDVIGYVGMTGNTGGPHVCYRFWKNGRQVDPFKQKLPEAKPISDSLRTEFLTYMAPIKAQLNEFEFTPWEERELTEKEFEIRTAK